MRQHRGAHRLRIPSLGCGQDGPAVLQCMIEPISSSEHGRSFSRKVLLRLSVSVVIGVIAYMALSVFEQARSSGCLSSMEYIVRQVRRAPSLTSAKREVLRS